MNDADFPIRVKSGSFAAGFSRRSFVGLLFATLFARPTRTFKLQAIAAAHMPNTRTIRSMDPRIAAHFMNGGVFEIRDYASGPEVILHDSLEARWKLTVTPEGSPFCNRRLPLAISLYRPA